jgi:tRNA-dihydrouridine synthase A
MPEERLENRGFVCPRVSPQFQEAQPLDGSWPGGELSAMQSRTKVVAVAPMMDWTDRHCRYFHRGLTRRALLYTEMVTAEAVIRGDRQKLIGHDPVENPVALQLGGSSPGRLAEAARIGADFGYDEINLNVGCPSDRVQSGTFGACLMREPLLVGECIAAMKAAVPVPVTVKCRLGVDDQDPETALDRLADAVIPAGTDAIWVHARKAWLSGLSPKENRDVPPLDYDRVYRLKARLPGSFVGINGGIPDLAAASAHLMHVDGAMMGRAAYQRPAMLAGIDRLLGGGEEPVDLLAAAERMIPYAERHCAAGGRVSSVTRHMIGLFQGAPGARRWRQILTVEGTRPGAGPDVISRALEAVAGAGVAKAA